MLYNVVNYTGEDTMSTANLPAEKVLEACTEYLTARSEQIQFDQGKLVEKAVAREAKRWFFKPKTRKQLIEDFKSDRWNLYNILEFRGSLYSTNIEELALLARLAGNGVVSVSASDANTIESQLLGVINA